MVTWWRERRRRLAAEAREREEHPWVPMHVIATRYGLEAQLMCRGFSPSQAAEVAKKAFDEFEGERPTEASMTALRDRVHELANERRNGEDPGW